MTQTVGIIDLIYKGTKIPTEKGASIYIGGYKANPTNAGRQTFSSLEYENSHVRGTTVLQQGQSLAFLNDPTPGELQAVCDTGQTYIVADAVRVRVPTITGGEGGKLAIEFVGSPATEILS